MAKIRIEFETEYDKGDFVIFKKDNRLLVGIIEGYYVDRSADDSVWYNIRVNKDTVFTYSTEGDVAEWDILCKVDANEKIKAFIISGEMLYE